MSASHLFFFFKRLNIMLNTILLTFSIIHKLYHSTKTNTEPLSTTCSGSLLKTFRFPACVSALLGLHCFSGFAAPLLGYIISYYGSLEKHLKRSCCFGQIFLLSLLALRTNRRNSPDLSWSVSGIMVRKFGNGARRRPQGRRLYSVIDCL